MRLFEGDRIDIDEEKMFLERNKKLFLKDSIVDQKVITKKHVYFKKKLRPFTSTRIRFIENFADNFGMLDYTSKNFICLVIICVYFRKMGRKKRLIVIPIFDGCQQKLTGIQRR